METAKLKKFAQFARRSLLEQVSTKLKLVLAESSAARRESAEAIKKLEEAIGDHGSEQVIERVAYIWFNRFCALRFMDVNRYTRIGVVSPSEGQFQPEILAEAKMGHIDEEMVHDKARQQIFALLDGKAPSQDPQAEAYRLLVVAACNFWNKAMPFLFQRIDDYTELLMPDDLLSGNSILAYTREAMTPDACEDVEVIGWLYQFYISEKKDEVFDGLKKNKKITPENIPAATQIFTPHWIVRYLVENSLGRLWLLNRPGSKLIEQMDYYIKPEQDETDFLRISKPEEIKICDPACGSGHMLTYAFDILYAIYEEEGYEPSEIPEKILTHNLYGIEIDERAGELAAFALTMKARAKQRRFFNRGVKPNICVLKNIYLTEIGTNSMKEGVFGTEGGTMNEHEWAQIVDVMVKSGIDRGALIHDLHLFLEADNFGSLLRPRLSSDDAQKAFQTLITYDQSVMTSTFGHRTLVDKCKQALIQADYLGSKYHVVVANPPYMGSGNMNKNLSKFVQDNYAESKSDLMACFMESGRAAVKENGYLGMINQQGWMFLDYFKLIRARIINENQIQSLLHLGPRAFPEVSGEVVQSVAFVLKQALPAYPGIFFRLIDFKSSTEKEMAFLSHVNRFVVLQTRHDKIPDSPLGYWFSESSFKAFTEYPPLSNYADVRAGLQTGNNEKFIRQWYEVSLNKHSIKLSPEVCSENLRKWFPYNKGGAFRKWYGNRELVVDWGNDGENIKNDKLERLKKGLISASNSKPKNTQYYFREGITWSTTGGRFASFRLMPQGELFDIKGSSLFPKTNDIIILLLGFLNSCVARNVIGVLTPTLDYNPGYIAKIPTNIDIHERDQLFDLMAILIKAQEDDWNSYETSWDFTTLPLLSPDYRQSTLKATYERLRTQWCQMTQEMQRLEEENNRIFIDAYGLQDELTPDVPLNEITLTCNPHHRYRGDKTEDELEALLLADTMRELVSYAVGCMFGRYSLDKPGLILANQGETIEDYLQRVPEPSFRADDDNVIPMLDGDWFTDDIAERFREFLRVTFGEEYYEENLQFVENALNIKGKRNYGIRDYFLSEFYNDHVRRYKKRPIYWLFSSPKGSFNALIYMHRYRPDTVSVVLNDYLREFRTKFVAHKNHLEAVSISGSASQGEKTKALKEIEKIAKMIAELEEYEREVLYPLATEQVEIDLDDGVKVNYAKLGAALKKIAGLEAANE